MLDVLRILIKAKDVRERNVIDDFGRCQPIHLLLKNVAQAFFGVRELLLHLLALIQPLDDFRDIKARLLAPGAHSQFGSGKTANLPRRVPCGFHFVKKRVQCLHQKEQNRI